MEEPTGTSKTRRRCCLSVFIVHFETHF